jgi:hypothetical protein
MVNLTISGKRLGEEKDELASDTAVDGRLFRNGRRDGRIHTIRGPVREPGRRFCMRPQAAHQRWYL